MRRTSLILALLSCGLGVACGDVPAGTGSAGPQPHDSAPGATSGSDTAAAGDTTLLPAADSAFIALEGEGLRVFLAGSGSARPLPFGTPSDDARAMLDAVMKTAPVEEGENVDCAAAYVRWDNGLTTWFSNGRFAGWHIRDSRLTTVDGVGLGTTRADLDSRGPVIDESSLGVEFTIGGVAGLLESDASDARVVHLWAGHTCIAR